jgi:hypothetical protein
MMRVGGNSLCKSFFEANGIVGMPLLRKYESDVAGAYRAKIVALVEGKPWTDPQTPEELKKYRISSSALTSSGSSVSKPITPRSPETPGSYLRAPPTTGGHQNYAPAPAPNYNNYTRYGNGSSFSSDDYNGNSRSGGYQTPARPYTAKGTSDLDRFGNMIQEEGQKGLNLAVKYFNKARLLTGNGYDNLDKSNSLLGHAAGSGTRYTAGSNERNTYSSPSSNADFFRMTSPNAASRVLPPNQGRGGRIPVQNKPSPVVVVPTQTVDEGGWDLSAWEDNQWDEQPVPNQTPVVENTKQNVKVSESVDDLWDFGSKSKPASTVKHNPETIVAPKTEDKTSHIPIESNTTPPEQKELSIPPPIEDRENTPPSPLETDILTPTSGQTILQEENSIMT